MHVKSCSSVYYIIIKDSENDITSFWCEHILNLYVLVQTEVARQYSCIYRCVTSYCSTVDVGESWMIA